VILSFSAYANSVQIGLGGGASYCNQDTTRNWPSPIRKPLYGIYLPSFIAIGLPKWIYLNLSSEYSQKGGGWTEYKYNDNTGSTDTITVHQTEHTFSIGIGPKLKLDYKKIHPYAGFSARCDWLVIKSSNVPVLPTGKTTYVSMEPDVGFALYGGMEIGNWKFRPFFQFVWEDEFTVLRQTFFAISAGVSYSLR
jgi:hypothetical protein